jgi:hypothetical protein
MAQPELRARPLARLEDNEVHSDGQSREGDAARQAVLEHAAERGSKVAALAVVERLLREAEVAATSPADLHDYQHLRRARVDRHKV